ncbi:MAG TPA: hypothetical protein VMM85_06450 [Methylomirabilota bacterium]|nr:hypothetical protein [Methylomirabilota bacterium]
MPVLVCSADLQALHEIEFDVADMPGDLTGTIDRLLAEPAGS